MAFHQYENESEFSSVHVERKPCYSQQQSKETAFHHCEHGSGVVAYLNYWNLYHNPAAQNLTTSTESAQHTQTLEKFTPPCDHNWKVYLRCVLSYALQVLTLDQIFCHNP